MATATYNGATIAQADEYEVVEGNVYFAPDDVNSAFLEPNSKTTSCFWKGTAHYYDVVVDGQVNEAAAWYYPEPKDKAANIKDRIAFWRGVQVDR